MFGPVVDLRFEEYESFERLAITGVVFDTAFMGFARGAYCRYAEWNHPHVSPIRGDLRDYPPALVVVGTSDPMVSSCQAFAAALRAAESGATELLVCDGMPHGFYFWPGVFPTEEARAYAVAGTFLNRHLVAVP
jgi:acetyl esterase